jgi:hypothetical protein
VPETDRNPEKNGTDPLSLTALLGHTVGHVGCLPDVVTAFFEAESVVGLDTSCVRQMPPSRFATSWGELAPYT